MSDEKHVAGAPVPHPGGLRALAGRWAAQKPDALAFIDSDARTSLTFGELWRRALSLASEVRAAGPRAGRVAILLPAGLDFPVAYLACRLADAVAIPMPYPDTDDLERILGPLHHMLADSGTRYILCDAALLARRAAGERALGLLDDVVLAAVDTVSGAGPAGRAGEGEADAAEDDPSAAAHVIYTSGSTSAAKGVVLSRAAVAHNVRYTSERWAFGEHDVHLTFGAPFHSAGIMVGYLMPLYRGATSVLMRPATFARAPLRWLEAIARYGVTHTACGNSALERLFDQLAGRAAALGALDLSSWRVAVVGGDPLHPSTLEALKHHCAPLGFGPERVVTAYGMTEGAGLITTSQRGRAPRRIALDPVALTLRRVVQRSPDHTGSKVAVSCGEPSHGVRVAIVDPVTQRRCAPGNVGEVWYTSPSLFTGYLGADPARVLSRVEHDTEAEYLRTGDAGLLVDGEVFILGRLKELILQGDRWFYPQDLEWIAEAATPGLQGLPSIAVAGLEPGSDEILLAREVPEALAGDAGGLARVAADIHRALVRHSDTGPLRVVLVPAGSLPRIYTSAKKPRLLARRMLEQRAIPELSRHYFGQATASVAE
jgi:acyl-CoA synthetase (AMP-forming)/AMP-acid ligase II